MHPREAPDVGRNRFKTGTLDVQQARAPLSAQRVVAAHVDNNFFEQVAAQPEEIAVVLDQRLLVGGEVFHPKAAGNAIGRLRHMVEIAMPYP